MRSPMVRLTSLAVLFCGMTAVAQQSPPTKKDGDDKKAEKKTEPGNLDDLIAQALRNNPDIRVAEAKVREAEAELERTRLATAQKVAGLYHSIESARKSREEAQERLKTSQQLRQNNAVSNEDVRAAQLTWERFVSEVAKYETEMQALLGKMPGKRGQDKAEAFNELHLYAAQAAGLNYLKRVYAVEENRDEAASSALVWLALRQAMAVPAPQGTMAQRIRKALDSTVDGDYKGKQFADVFKDFEKNLDGIGFRVVVRPMPSGQMDINLGKVPLGSAIQAVNDILSDYRFVVRDYGILFTHRTMLPPGALLLHDFWKSDAGKEKPKAGDDVNPKQ